MKKSAGTQMDDPDEDGPAPLNLDLHEVDEIDMLRARIDEQSALIMILKQRADDAVNRAVLFERRSDEQSKQLTNVESHLQEETRKFSMLENRFFELASNHEEMIKIKDEYKASNEKLRTENIQLRRDNEQLFSKQLNSLTEEVDSMQRFNEAVTREAKALDQQNKKLEALLKEATELREKERREMLKTHGTRVGTLEEELLSYKDRVKVLHQETEELKSRLATLERQHLSETQRLTKEKDEMLGLVMERGKIIQDKQLENKTLQMQTTDLQKQLQSARQRFQEESDRVDSDVRVQRARDQLKALQYRYDSLSKAHEAFKRHTGSMLDNERQLNNQLATYTTASMIAPPKAQGAPFSLPSINSPHNTQMLSYGVTVDSSSDRR